MGSVGKISDKKYAYCCLPDGCSRKFSELISLKEPGDAVKICCTNEQCMDSQWMHKSCFAEWEQEVIGFLRMSAGWNERQCIQSVWTKKGYDLAFRACICRCGRGYIRKEVGYTMAAESDEDRKLRRRKIDLQVVSSLMSPEKMSSIPIHIRRQSNNGLRLRSNSISSSSSNGSPPMSSDGSPASLSPGGAAGWNRFDFLDAEHAALGCIFKRRTDFSVFGVLPRSQQNPYHIKIEDDGLHGNDETRYLLLTTLSRYQATHMPCVLCHVPQEIFDEYPLVDGTFFLSPVRYLTDVQLPHDQKQMYLNVVCMRCMSASSQSQKAQQQNQQNHLQPRTAVPCCVACHTPWNGSSLLIGTMYSYDIFAATPCCAFRLTCKNCRGVVVEPGSPLAFFSEYSKAMQCPYCQTRDYHFVKPLPEIIANVKA